MKIASTKFLIFLNLLGSLVVVSSGSWFSVWLGMEITSFTLPAMILSKDQSLTSKINSWKYYMVQCYSSSIFLMSSVCLSFSSLTWMYTDILWFMVIFSMLFKMGILPFHGWLFHLSKSTSWVLFMIISTIQKIGPLVVISQVSKMWLSTSSYELVLSVLVSILCLKGLVTYSIRYLFITSSMINTAWMISSASMSKVSFLSFMVLYFLHVFILFILFNVGYVESMDSVYFNPKEKFSSELNKLLVFFSMIGLPPMVGFFMKMSIIQQLITFNHLITSISLILSSSIIMILYMKLCICTIFNMRTESLQFKPSAPLFISTVFLMTSSFFFLI